MESLKVLFEIEGASGFLSLLAISLIAAAARLSNNSKKITLNDFIKGFIVSLFAAILAKFTANELVASEHFRLLTIAVCAYTSPKLLNIIDQAMEKTGGSFGSLLIRIIKGIDKQ